MSVLRKMFRENLKSSDCIRNCSLVAPTLFITCRGIASKLFVGSLSFYTSDKGLSEAFSPYGQVIDANVIKERLSNKSKGFGFVTFASENEAEKALAEMNGKTLDGRVIFVDYAKPSKNRFGGGMPIARGPPEPIDDKVKVDYFNPEPNT